MSGLAPRDNDQREATWTEGLPADIATCTFRRSLEGMSMDPKDGFVQWTVSQAAPFRLIQSWLSATRQDQERFERNRALNTLHRTTIKAQA